MRQKLLTAVVKGIVAAEKDLDRAVEESEIGAIRHLPEAP